MIVSGEQQKDAAIHINTRIHSPPDSSPLPTAPALSRIPCAIQQILVGYPL